MKELLPFLALLLCLLMMFFLGLTLWSLWCLRNATSHGIAQAERAWKVNATVTFGLTVVLLLLR